MNDIDKEFKDSGLDYTFVCASDNTWWWIDIKVDQKKAEDIFHNTSTALHMLGHKYSSKIKLGTEVIRIEFDLL